MLTYGTGSKYLRSFEIFFVGIMNRMSLNVKDYFNDRIWLCDANLVNAANWINTTHADSDQLQVLVYNDTY